MELGAVGEEVDKADKGPAAPLLLLPVVVGVDKVLELGPTELAGADSENETDGVHEVGLAGAVGADYRREVVEGPNGLEALVGLKVLELQAEDFARGG